MTTNSKTYYEQEYSVGREKIYVLLYPESKMIKVDLNIFGKQLKLMAMMGDVEITQTTAGRSKMSRWFVPIDWVKEVYKEERELSELIEVMNRKLQVNLEKLIKEEKADE